MATLTALKNETLLCKFIFLWRIFKALIMTLYIAVRNAVAVETKNGLIGASGHSALTVLSLGIEIVF